MRRGFVLLGYLVLVVGGGWLIGYLNLPGDWYAHLAKPWFNPPNWVFPLAWTALYVMIAFAGWRIDARDVGGTAKALWWGQLLLNFAWSPLFFSAHRMVLALADIVLLLVAILGFIGSAWRQDRVAAWLFVPYAGWVAFATLLNAALLRLN
jgi:benzodiazapine receptor